MTAEGRHAAALWGEAVSYPAPVLGVIYTDLELDASEYERNLGEVRAKLDDAFWARFVRRAPVTPQGFLNWWVARRWLRPRDITRE